MWYVAVFVRLEGFPTLAECLESPHPSIRWRAAEIVAICTQNNYFSQAKAMEMRLLEPLVAMTDRDSDDQCKTKAFFAVSSESWMIVFLGRAHTVQQFWDKGCQPN